MNCLEAKQALSCHLDAELTNAQEHVLYQHLVGCERCRQEWNSTRRLHELLQDACAFQTAPPDLAQGVLTHLFPENLPQVIPLASKPQPGRRWVRQVAGMALAVGTAVAAWTGFWAIPRLLPTQVGPSLPPLVEVVEQYVPAYGLTEPAEDLPVEVALNPIRTVVEPLPVIDKLSDSSLITGPALPDGGAEAVMEPTLTSPQQPVAPGPLWWGQEGINLPGQEPVQLAMNMGATGLPAAVSHIMLTSLAVSNQETNFKPVWSPDGERIYYLSRQEEGVGQGVTSMRWVNADGRERGTLSDAPLDALVVTGGEWWTADGQRLAYVRQGAGSWEIWQRNLNGEETNLTPLTQAGITPVGDENQQYWAYFPVWSRGNDLAFLTDRFGGRDLMLLTAAGELKVLTQTTAVEASPGWSPDGQHLIFVRSQVNPATGQQESSLWAMDRSGDNERPLTPLFNGTLVASWSATGEQVAINVIPASTNAGHEERGVWIYNWNSRTLERLSSIGGGQLLKWSPDGQKLVLTDTRGVVYALIRGRQQGDHMLYQLTPTGDVSGNVTVSWSPDSRRLVLDWAPSLGRGIWLANLPSQADTALAAKDGLPEEIIP